MGTKRKSDGTQDYTTSLIKASPLARIRFCRSIFIMMAVIYSLMFGQLAAWAGPPFFTDDPEPADYKHGEFYVASQYIQAR